MKTLKQLNVQLLINEFNAKIIYGNESETLENFSKDTREIKENDVYVGIKGENFDGNLFYEDAFNKGAKIAILEKKSIDEDNIKKYDNKTVILVDNSIELLQKLANYKIKNSNVKVVAVTGSVGKTSTKDIVYNTIKTKYRVIKTEGNLNNHLGLPLTILRLKDEEVIVLEMGMNHFNEISILSKIAMPDIAIITNIGTAHIGNLGSRENILKAKLEILDGMNNGTLIINNDNDLLHEHLDEIKKKTNVITVGIDNKSNYNATNIVDNVFSSEFKINNNDFKINVGGKPFIYNSLVSYAVGKLLNIDDKDIIKGIKEFKLSNNRMELININGYTLINDTYNASYDSVIAAIDLVSKSNYKRKILILGDILELGEFSSKIHEDIGKYIINKNITSVILIGNEVNNIKKVLENNKFNEIYSFKSEELSYNFLDEYLSKDDIVLIKGSHGMNLINIVNYLKTSKSE